MFKIGQYVRRKKEFLHDWIWVSSASRLENGQTKAFKIIYIKGNRIKFKEFSSVFASRKFEPLDKFPQKYVERMKNV